MADDDWVADTPAAAAPAAADNWTADKPTTWLDTANDFGRAVTNAATFGMGNRVKAGIEYLKGNAPSYSEGVDAQARATEVARERSPAASLAGDVYGSFAIPSLGAGRIAARAGGGVLARAGAYGGTGAVTGAAAGAGNTYTGDPMDYLKNAAIGGAISAPLGAAGGAIFGRGPARSGAEVPRQPHLYAEKNQNYTDLANLPARYEPGAFAQRADAVENLLYAKRFHPDRSPQSWEALEAMRGAPPPGPQRPVNVGSNAIVDPARIDYIRKGLSGDPFKGATPTDKASANIVRRAIDDFVLRPPPGAVVPGTEPAARQASQMLNRAHGNYAAYKRTQAFDDLVESARGQGASRYSGLNRENAMRNKIGSFIASRKGQSPASKAGFNQAEIDAFRGFERGTISGNTLRYGGNVLGGGGGIGAGITAGGITAILDRGEDLKGSAVAGGAAAGAGLGLRMLANRRANINVQRLQDMVSQRSPLYRERAARAPMVPGAGSPMTAKAMRDAITAAIISPSAEPTRVRISKPDDPSDWE